MKLRWYYVSRSVVSAAAAAVIWAGTHSIWLAVLTGVVTLSLFVWTAHSGHFVVDPSRPLTPLRRDEREQWVTARAANWAFAALMLLAGALALSGSPGADWFSLAVFVGFAVFFVARAVLRRRP
jgi:hypothetical protein